MNPIFKCFIIKIILLNCIMIKTILRDIIISFKTFVNYLKKMAHAR